MYNHDHNRQDVVMKQAVFTADLWGGLFFFFFF